MQTHFNEISGFSGLSEEISLEAIFQQYSWHFHETYCFDPPNVFLILFA